jgi:hypothetical protein
MKHTKESICVRIFFTTCPTFVKNESKYVGAGKNFFGILISGWFQ